MRSEMIAQRLVIFVVIAPDGGLLARAIHSLNLVIGLRVIWLGQAMHEPWLAQARSKGWPRRLAVGPSGFWVDRRTECRCR